MDIVSTTRNTLGSHRDEDGLLLRSGLKLAHMRMIVALADSGSVSAAAATLNVSQPAASRMIGEMEAIVAAPLLDRHARGVSLTSYGHALARRARSILIELREVDREIADLRSGKGGSVSLGCVTAPAVSLAMPAIRELRELYPRLQINIQVEASPVLARELLASRLDFAIARIPDDLNPRLFDSRVIGIEKAKLVVRRGHPLAGGRKVSLADTAGFDWVLQAEGSLLRRTIEQHFLRRDILLPERVLNTSSLLLTLVSITQSDAIAATSVDVAEFLTTGLDAAVETLPLDVDIEVQPYSLLTAHNRLLSPAAQLLHDAIMRRIR